MSATTATPPGLVLVGWKPMAKNSLRGFASVRIRNGLTIYDIPVHATHGKAWAALPSKALVGADGVAQRDPGTGKVKYAPILAWPDRDTSDRFSATVVAAVEAAYPGAMA